VDNIVIDVTQQVGSSDFHQAHVRYRRAPISANDWFASAVTFAKQCGDGTFQAQHSTAGGLSRHLPLDGTL
jgi:hypothetical protein